MFFDVWLVLAQAESLCREQVQVLLESTRRLDFQTNLEKSDLEPLQHFVCMGVAFDSVAFMASPSLRRIDRLLSFLGSLRSLTSASARQRSAFLGTMESLDSLVPLGRVF